MNTYTQQQLTALPDNHVHAPVAINANLQGKIEDIQAFAHGFQVSAGLHLERAFIGIVYRANRTCVLSAWNRLQSYQQSSGMTLGYVLGL